MIETPALSLPQRLKAATAEEHRRVERCGVMATLLRGRIERLAYLALLRNLHALYARAGAGAAAPGGGCRGGRPGGDARTVPPRRAESDLQDLAARRPTRRPRRCGPPPSRTSSACARSKPRSPELLVAHAYVRYLGDLSGGQQLRRIVSRALGSGGRGRHRASTTSATPHAGEPRWRCAFARRSTRSAPGHATPTPSWPRPRAPSRRHGQLFEQLAAAG